MHEFEESFCSYCETPKLAVNLDGCLICETFTSACSECMTAHRKTHTEAEVESFRREMLDEPDLTPRERINLEIKAQIRQHAETLCQLIDDQESLVKRYEHQCGVLSEEIDRLRPAS